MDITEVDQNMKIEVDLPEKEIAWHDVTAAPFRLYGVTDPAEPLDTFVRMPRAAAQRVSGGVNWLNTHTAGIRVRFATDSPFVALHVRWHEQFFMSHMALSGSSGFDLYRLKGGRSHFVAALMPPGDTPDGFSAIVYIPAGEYELNFPLYHSVDQVFVGIKPGSGLSAGNEEYVNDKPVVFYGSSITQGGCASRPGTCYQPRLSRALNMNYVNLGFSGSCKGEPAMAEYLAGLGMAALVCDYDHNSPDPDHLRATHYALYETVRRAQPDLPYVIVTRPTRGLDKMADERLSVIMDTYRRALEAGDRHVYFVDGGGFFPGEDAADCTVDGCHPTDLGFYFMAQGLYPVLKRILY